MRNYDKEEIERLKALLDNEHEWPTNYLFKFIVPKGKEEELRQVFPVAEVKLRNSSKGNYVSVTVSLRMESSSEVLAVYYQANKIEGLIAL